MIQTTELEIDAISGFVTCDYDSRWWLAFVLGVDTDNSEVKLTLLHPSAPSSSFQYPDIFTVPSSDILTFVNPRASTRRTYSLTKREMKISTDKLSSK